jgi:AcrR family transcriptional regulator
VKGVQIPNEGPEEVERRDYAALVGSLAGALDLRGGLSEAVEIVGYNTMSDHIAGFLDLEAGLQSALAVSTGVDAVAREVRTSRAGQYASSSGSDASRRSALAVSIRTGTAPRGVRMPRDERRAQLLAAARDVFVTNGYHATVMDDIAEHAGVSKPVLYQHFPGKLELYLALLERHADELVGRVQTAIEKTHDNWQRVRNAVGAYFDFVDGDGDGDGEAFRLVFESDLRNQPAVQTIVDRMETACIQAIAQVVVADAGLDPARAWLVAVGVVGISKHSARYWLTRRHELPKEEAVALTAALAWKGLAGFPLRRRSVHDTEHGNRPSAPERVPSRKVARSRRSRRWT